MKVRVAIVGATGYTGAELVRLLMPHPQVEIVAVTSARQAGSPLDSACPWLSTRLILSEFDPETTEADYFFLCQEAGFAGEVAPRLIERGFKVIDLSADYRLSDSAVYETYYNRSHPDPNPEFKVAYGLPELVSHESIREAGLVANPGCYPTATLLGLMPMVRAEVVNGIPVIDAKSGVSGAGRSKAVTEYLFSELTGGFKSYAAVGHRHTPEIEQLAGRTVRFTPHLIPSARGIHSTMHVPVSKEFSGEDLAGMFNQAYVGRDCVRFVADWPSTKQVQGTNRCDIHAEYDARTGHVVVASVIDNLVKGASGQAVQNLNIMCGFDETLGLPLNGVWP